MRKTHRVLVALTVCALSGACANETVAPDIRSTSATTTPSEQRGAPERVHIIHARDGVWRVSRTQMVSPAGRVIAIPIDMGPGIDSTLSAVEHIDSVLAKLRFRGKPRGVAAAVTRPSAISPARGILHFDVTPPIDSSVDTSSTTMSPYCQSVMGAIYVGTAQLAADNANYSDAISQYGMDLASLQIAITEGDATQVEEDEAMATGDAAMVDYFGTLVMYDTTTLNILAIDANEGNCIYG